MKLIGMLDSPYVRRTAISLRLLGIEFEHQPLSVFGDFDAFRAFNPVVKAPTLVPEEGPVLMDSTLIIDYAEHLAGRSLMPDALGLRQQATSIIGLALAACEKTVQIVYERNLRPLEKQHEPWLVRVQTQLQSAYTALESALQAGVPAAAHGGMGQAGVTAAVAWGFTQWVLPDRLDAQHYPRLLQLSQQAEQHAEFKAYPVG